MKYLFTAYLRDGSLIQQTAADVSTIDPSRSAYYDVAQRIDDVVAFQLDGDGHSYGVDLVDGHFEIDGCPFSAQPISSNIIPIGGKFNPLYFRDHQHSFNSEYQELDHTVQYRFGWEYLAPNGQKYVQTIVVT